MKIPLTIISIGIIIFASHFFSGVFNKTKVPDTLWLFVIGLLFGPVLGFITPAHFGIVGKIFSAITLVVILFESGLELHWYSIKESWKGTLRLTVFNFIATVMIVSIATLLLTDLDVLTSLILGSILGGTSSAVVTGLTRQLKLTKNSESVLIVESALSDVFTLAVPLALIASYKEKDLNIGSTGLYMLSAFVIALALGILGGLIWSVLLKKIRTIENSNFTTVAFVFIIYGIVELLGLSGPIAALSFGIVLGNIDSVKIPIINNLMWHQIVPLNQAEKNFFSEIVFLLRTFFFIYIGISINLSDNYLLLTGLTITITLFIIRILVVKLAAKSTTTKRDLSFMSVMIPKGLGAAVLASIPLQEGLPAGEAIQTITFSIILFTTVLTTILVFMLERFSFMKKMYSTIFYNYPDNH